MKKLIALLLACIMVLSLCACGTGDKPEASETPSPTEQVSNVDTCILMEADENMINTYSLLAVNPNAPFTDADGNAVSDVKINADGAETFIDWMLSEASKLIKEYGVEEYGDNLFYLKDDAPKYDDKIANASDENRVIRLSTTTSVKDSGLVRPRVLPAHRIRELHPPAATRRIHPSDAQFPEGGHGLHPC